MPPIKFNDHEFNKFEIKHTQKIFYLQDEIIISSGIFFVTSQLLFFPQLPDISLQIFFVAPQREYISLKRCHNSIMLIDTLALSAAGLSQHGALAG